MRIKRFRNWAMCIVWAVLPAIPAAQAGPEILDEIGWLPADIDFALAVRDMNQVREMPLGQGLTNLVNAGLLFGGAQESATLDAWRSLSRELGFTEQQAFSALLGERFFCASRVRDDGESDWVMYSRTTTKIARIIRQRLDVSPREIKHNRVLMSLEGGKFRLGSMIDGDNAWLMLAPMHRDGLFQQIANENRTPAWLELGDTIPMRELRTLGDGELAVYMTFDGRADHGWFGLVADAQFDTVRFRLLADPGKDLPPVEPWSTARFDEFRDGALFAHVERLPTDEAPQVDPNALDGIGAMLGELRNLLEIPRRMLGDDLGLILGNRFALAVYPKNGGGVALGAGMEASDVKALADPGDAAMRSIVESIRLFYGADQTEFNFVGALPRAERSITLEPSLPDAGQQKLFEQGLPPFGDRLDFTWSFRDTIGQAPLGWWVVGTEHEAFDRAAESLTIWINPETDLGITAPWLILLDAHPAALMEELHRGGVPKPASPTGIESVDSLTLRTWIDDGGELVVGEGAVRITEPRELRKGRRRHQR